MLLKVQKLKNIYKYIKNFLPFEFLVFYHWYYNTIFSRFWI